MMKTHDELIDIFDEVAGIHGCWDINYPSNGVLLNIHYCYNISVYDLHGEVVIVLGEGRNFEWIPITEFIRKRTDLSEADKIALILKYS